MKKTVRKQYLKETLTGSRRHYRNVKITADGHSPYFSKYRDVIVGLKWLAANIPEAAAAVVSRRMRGEPMVPTVSKPIQFFSDDKGMHKIEFIDASDRIRP